MKLTVFMILPIFWSVECMPFDQGSGTERVVTSYDMATSYPDLHKRFVDINNVSPEVSSILRQNNMNLDEIKMQHAMLQNKTMLIRDKNRDKDYYQVIPSSTYSTPTAAKDITDEEMRLISIRNSLEKTLRESDDGDQQSNAEFDFAFPALCEIPRHINLTDWFGQKTWNIFFKPNYRQFNVKSVFLRLYKVTGVDTKASKECQSDVGEFYKLTVSVYSRKRKEMKKKIIYAQMVQSNFNGWIEIDALSTLKFWDLPRNNYGMAIDIYDQDDNQLDAKEHFHLQNCEAGPQVPWRSFKLVAETFRRSVSEADVEIIKHMSTGPRIDLISSSPANYKINSAEQQQQQSESKSSRHLRHTHHRHHSSEGVMEFSESKSHQTSAERRDHSHRSNSQVEET